MTNYTHWFIRARLKTRQLLLLIALAVLPAAPADAAALFFGLVASDIVTLCISYVFSLDHFAPSAIQRISTAKQAK